LFLEILPYVDNGGVKKFLKFVVALSFMAHGSYQKPVACRKQQAMSQSTAFMKLYKLWYFIYFFTFITYFYYS
jgi:hypothetical protein